jgi:hypothetical protein
MLLRISQGAAVLAGAVLVYCWGWVWLLHERAYGTPLQGCESRPWMLGNPGHPDCPTQWMLIEGWGAAAFGFLLCALWAMYLFRKR